MSISYSLFYFAQSVIKLPLIPPLTSCSISSSSSSSSSNHPPGSLFFIEQNRRGIRTLAVFSSSFTHFGSLTFLPNMLTFLLVLLAPTAGPPSSWALLMVSRRRRLACSRLRRRSLSWLTMACNNIKKYFQLFSFAGWFFLFGTFMIL